MRMIIFFFFDIIRLILITQQKGGFKRIASNIFPKYISTDHDPLFRYHLWKKDLDWNGIKEIKSVPHVPFGHPYIERLIGTVRRDFTDRSLIWSKNDAEEKLELYKEYYNFVSMTLMMVKLLMKSLAKEISLQLI